jgi:hypothetical protein
MLAGALLMMTFSVANAGTFRIPPKNAVGQQPNRAARNIGIRNVPK